MSRVWVSLPLQIGQPPFPSTQPVSDPTDSSPPTLPSMATKTRRPPRALRSSIADHFPASRVSVFSDRSKQQSRPYKKRERAAESVGHVAQLCYAVGNDSAVSLHVWVTLLLIQVRDICSAFCGRINCSIVQCS